MIARSSRLAARPDPAAQRSRAPAGRAVRRDLATMLATVIGAPAFVGVIVLLVLPPRPQPTLVAEQILWHVGWILLAAVGVLVIRRRPDNRIGEALTVTGVLVVVAGFIAELGRFLVDVRPGAAPEVGIVTWVFMPVMTVTFALMPLVFLLFPDGGLPSRRWRWVPRALAVLGVAGAVVVAVVTWPHRGPALLDDPTPGLDAPAAQLVFAALTTGLLVGIASLGFRYRRADVVQRHQLKWVLAASAVVFVSIAVTNLGMAQTGLGAVLASGLSVIVLPVAVGVAIFRYRLFEIDRIISRTATYGLVTAVLVGVYVTVAVVPAAVFALESELLVATATLAAAAAFGPVRRKAQVLIDKRFDRARYDAREVVEGFAAGLRGDVELGHLRDELVAVVSVTVQPSHLSLWFPHRDRT